MTTTILYTTVYGDYDRTESYDTDADTALELFNAAHHDVAEIIEVFEYDDASEPIDIPLEIFLDDESISRANELFKEISDGCR